MRTVPSVTASPAPRRRKRSPSVAIQSPNFVQSRASSTNLLSSGRTVLAKAPFSPVPRRPSTNSCRFMLSRSRRITKRPSAASIVTGCTQLTMTCTCWCSRSVCSTMAHCRSPSPTSSRVCTPIRSSSMGERRRSSFASDTVTCATGFSTFGLDPATTSISRAAPSRLALAVPLVFTQPTRSRPSRVSCR